ncbi:MAG: hypothetical protein GY851_26220 [bacterium]|nr:hypothetical protein [bacterium]
MRWCWLIAAVAAVLAGCAGLRPPVDLGSLEAPGGQRVGTHRSWRLDPEGSLERALGQGAQGTGFAFIPDLVARDVDLEATVRPGAGTVGLVLRATGKSIKNVSLHAVTLHQGGVSLWLHNENGWRAVHNYLLPVDPAVKHTLRVRARGDTIAVTLDKKSLFKARSVSLNHPGRVGVCCSGGRCAILSLRCRTLDRNAS